VEVQALAKVKVRMPIDPFETVRRALARVEKHVALGKVVSLNYDEEADVLYVKFRHAKVVDNEPLDEKGLILASLDESQEVVGLMIMEASSFTREV
jgi:uncharacterized protein YuzE